MNLKEEIKENKWGIILGGLWGFVSLVLYFNPATWRTLRLETWFKIVNLPAYLCYDFFNPAIFLDRIGGSGIRDFGNIIGYPEVVVIGAMIGYLSNKILNIIIKMKGKMLFAVVLILTLSMSLSLGNSVTNDIQINLDVLDGIRNPSEYPGRIEIIYRGTSENQIEINNMKILYQNSIIWQKPISKILIGVGREYLQFESALQIYSEIQSIENPTQYQIDIARNAYKNAINLYPEVSKGMHSEIVTIDSNLIFGNEFFVGNKKTITFVIEVTHNGQKYEVIKDLAIEVLPPIPKPNIGFEKTKEGTRLMPVPADEGWYYGDLHVHSDFTDCDWPANGQYNIWERRVQAMMAGKDWISVTDHGYCMSEFEWSIMKQQADFFTDSRFIVLPSEEFSVREDKIGGDGV